MKPFALAHSMKSATRYDLPGAPGIPSVYQAAALRTLGFPSRCSVETIGTSAGRTELRWYVTGGTADARAIVLDKLAGAPPTLTAMAALYRCAMAALEANANLGAWMRGGQPYYGPDDEVLPINCDPDAAHEAIPAALLAFAAAAIACGHTPRPHLHRSTGQPMPSLLSRAPGGTTLQQLGEAEKALRARWRQRGGIVTPITIGTHPPDAHPFLFAREAIEHLRVCCEEQAAARTNPVALLAGRGGRSAAVSASYLDTASTAELVEQHLAGMLS